MNSYPFQSELFKNILEHSKAIEGRFFVCPNMGREINSDELGQVIKDIFDNSGLKKKYPLCLQMPPICYGYFSDSKGEWEMYKGILFFLTSTYYDGNNQVKSPNTATGTSTHTIPEDWHDMKRAAVNFVRVLNSLTRSKGLINTRFRLTQDKEKIITPVSQIGVDKASGVRLDLWWSQFTGCVIEDYDEGEISDIVIPEEDSHPEHAL